MVGVSTSPRNSDEIRGKVVDNHVVVQESSAENTEGPAPADLYAQKPTGLLSDQYVILS